MINFAVFEQLREEEYPDALMPFLAKLRVRLIREKPYRGLTILHNTPLTLEAVLKVEPLLRAGAEVVVSAVQTVKPNPRALRLLEEAGVVVDLEKQSRRHYDVHLDCCAELLPLPAPYYGAVELTQTGTHLYRCAQHLTYPVISVDDSSLKCLETIGTGAAVVQATQLLSQHNFRQQKVVVFGYGKVGRGIVLALQKNQCKVVVVESNPSLLAELQQKGLQAVDFSDKKAIQTHLRDAVAAITATGVKGLLSQQFHEPDFTNIVLANAGADDEYGENFSASRILNAKQAVNFSLPCPTPLNYLDPVLYAHNIAIDTLLANDLTPEYHPLHPQLSTAILQEWAAHSPEAAQVLRDYRH